MKMLQTSFKRFGLFVVVTAVAVGVIWWAKNTYWAAPVGAYKYEGKFVSDCHEINMYKVYYRDVLDLKPLSETKVDASYIKVFFADNQCTAPGQLLQMKLPKGTWDIQTNASSNGGGEADRVLVKLPAGKVEGVIKNSARAAQTEKLLIVKKGGGVPVDLQMDRAAEGVTAKSLFRIDGDKIYEQQADSPLDSQGYPTHLAKESSFVRF